MGIVDMNLHASFTFDSAGQGLFYHGNIYGSKHTFTMVYDCGTSGSASHLSNLVEQFSKNVHPKGSKLGLLAISHFDFDHVSHIPELLRKHEFDTVMLPHIAKELRAVFFAKSISEASGDWGDGFIRELSWLFRDPVGYFAEMSSPRQIIGIDSKDDELNDNTNDDNPSYKPFRPSQAETTVDENVPQLYYVGGGKQETYTEILSDLYSVFSGEAAFRVGFGRLSWLFKPLNIQEKPPPKFYSDVAGLIKPYNDDWSILLSEDSKRKELTKIYDLYIGKHRRNAHSLLIRHEPEQCSSLVTNGYRHCRHKRMHCMKCFDICCAGHCDGNSATVLLGDLELDGKARAVLEKHRFIDRSVGVILIPHHGADSEDLLWLDEQTRYNKCRTSLVVSHGLRNKHNHPRFIYDGTIARLKNTIGFANEESKYCYEICVSE
jgi:hypothetical protein